MRKEVSVRIWDDNNIEVFKGDIVEVLDPSSHLVVQVLEIRDNFIRAKVIELKRESHLKEGQKCQITITDTNKIMMIKLEDGEN